VATKSAFRRRYAVTRFLLLLRVAMKAPPPWILRRLGIETAAYREAADEDRLNALSVSTVGAYRTLLLRILGFESSVEHVVLKMTELDSSFIEKRLRSFFLHEDLLALDVSERDIESATNDAQLTIESPAHALGWLFVIERQMLLSGLIRRQLQSTFGTAMDDAMKYWSAYGEQPGARFKTFVDGLALHARAYDADLIVQGAVDAFRQQRHWYSGSPRVRRLEAIAYATT